MAEGLAFSIAENLIPKLTSIAISEIGLIYSCHEDLGNLEDTLSIIKDVLLDAEELQEKSYFVRNRIKKLEQVLYDADDLLDDVATENLRRKEDTRGCMTRQVCDFFSASNNIAFRHNMGHAIREIRDRVDQIASDISKFNFISNRVIVNTGPVGNRERDTDSFVSDVIIGREEEKNKMIKILISNTDDSSVSPIIPIVGIGGLGKTAFAKLVFNDVRVVKHFEPRIWVCVSENFDRKSIVRNILKSTERVEDLEMEDLQNQLREKLKGKRYLLVLDDVWNEDSERWIQLERLLMVEANGSIIMVTTRDRKVASAMGINSPFLLKGLSHEQSLELFEKLAFKEELEKVHHLKLLEEIKKIVKELVTRCEGVPLAIKTLGSAMRSKTSVSEWQSIQTNKIWSLSLGKSGILSVLKLSYDQLPTHLKYCFSYCSIFPKDHKIQCEMLIQLWMAQGYVQSSEQSENLEKIGIDYVKDFLSLSFFQEVEVDDYKNITSFKMHDLIHDLAIEVAASNYYFIAENDAKNNNVERVHHVSLESGYGEIPKRLLKEKGTRTFFLPVGWNGWRSHSDVNVRQRTIMSTFKCLRVLDLNNCGIEKMRSSIGLLTHLRYLDLSGNGRLKGLPNSISNLLNLQTLKLSGCCDMKKLPMAITKLINLRYLMIDGCDDLKRMPSGLEKLVWLQRLSKFVVGKDKCGRLSELKGLKNLGGELCIENLGMVGVDDAAATNLKEKEHLQSLELDWGYKEIPLSTTAELVLEGLEPHPNLEELLIYWYPGVKFPSWMTKMDNMVKITIQNSYDCQQLQPLDQLRCLKFLSLFCLKLVEYIQEEEVRDGQPPSSSVLFFPSLQELQLEKLPKLKGWWRKRESKVSSSTKIKGEEEEEEEKYASSSSSLVFSQLTKLTIERCPRFTSIPRHSPLLELVLFDVSEKLFRELLITKTAEEEEEEEETDIKMPSLISRLKTLSIKTIRNLEALPPRCLQNLTSLESLWICSCSELLYLTSSGEGKGQGFRDLTSLCYLEITLCRNLKSLSKELRHLTALECLKISDCPELDLADDDDGIHWQGLRSLRKLQISKIPKLVTLPVGIQHLTQLQQLGFSHCPKLASVPQEIHCLISLQQLEIDHCPKLSERCQNETGEDWLKIAHIPNLKIDGHMIRGTNFYL